MVARRSSCEFGLSDPCRICGGLLASVAVVGNSPTIQERSGSVRIEIFVVGATSGYWP